MQLEILLQQEKELIFCLEAGNYLQRFGLENGLVEILELTYQLGKVRKEIRRCTN